jgi:tripartite-type tricarboxylate transporter receptor subunit TctC
VQSITRLFIVALSSIVFFAGHATAAPDDFAGKTISIVVGFSSGGAYDLYARILGRYFGHHLAGDPRVIVQNMPGAGGLKAAGYLYSVAPKDGTVIGTFARGNVIAPLLGEGQFDSRQFNWLGSVTDDVNVCLSWQTSPVKNWDDLLTRPFAVAGQGPQADPNVYAGLVREMFHAPINLVSGYPGSSEIGLAMERGEIDGVCALSYSTIKSTFAEKLESKQFNIIFQAALKPSPDLPDVPFLLDKARNDDDRQLLALIMGVQGMARPFLAPPGVRPERVTALKNAFAATMHDPEFLADAEKSKLDIRPVSADDVSALVNKLYDTPKPVIEKAKAAFLQH